MGTKKTSKTTSLQSSQPLGQAPTLLGQALKEYRALHHKSQEELGYDLNLSYKTIGRYERGESGYNIHELRRIADFLGIAPERLGLATILDVPRSTTEIDAVTQHIWQLTSHARLIEAKTVNEQLLSGIKDQITSEEPTMLRSLAYAYHVGGYIAAMSNRSF